MMQKTNVIKVIAAVFIVVAGVTVYRLIKASRTGTAEMGGEQGPHN